MSIDARVFSWIRDLLLAYAGGLIAGAPLAVLAVWLTNREWTATVVLVAAMSAVLVGLRRAPRSRRETGVTAQAEADGPHAQARRHAA